MKKMHNVLKEEADGNAGILHLSDEPNTFQKCSIERKMSIFSK